MDVMTYIREELAWGHQLVEMVMAGVTEEQAHWQPPGTANSVGAAYAHVVLAEDMVINIVLRGGPPMFGSDWAGRTGISDPSPFTTLDWSRNVRVDLPALGQYAQAVYASANEYVASVTPDDLDRMVDLSSAGLGERSVGWCLSALVIAHLHNLGGEISAIKGAQGLKGYPF